MPINISIQTYLLLHFHRPLPIPLQLCPVRYLLRLIFPIPLPLCPHCPHCSQAKDLIPLCFPRFYLFLRFFPNVHDDFTILNFDSSEILRIGTLVVDYREGVGALTPHGVYKLGVLVDNGGALGLTLTKVDAVVYCGHVAITMTAQWAIQLIVDAFQDTLDGGSLASPYTGIVHLKPFWPGKGFLGAVALGDHKRTVLKMITIVAHE